MSYFSWSALNLNSSYTSFDLFHLNPSTAARAVILWVLICILVFIMLAFLIDCSSAYLIFSSLRSYFTFLTCWFFTRYMENRADWMFCFWFLWYSKFISYCDFKAHLLASWFIKRYRFKIPWEGYSSAYLHELLVILFLQVCHVFSSIVSLLDLLNGPLVLNL